ncbi:MAG: DUF3482 domain-containing protein [Microcoleaceae cyanobacterium MO_207.B10]|nr:DUF3482 domain-containing protein [Microcoleaceae cyanobacterium MO_207.B10]
MTDGNLIRIALAGRVNSGKTTMIRTLMRRVVGVVADRPNVTKEVEKVRSDGNDPHRNSYQGIQAIFYDCPGFQMASLSRHFINKLPELLKLDPKAKYDAVAIEAIKEVDVVIYVANLEDVPNDAYVNEIELIKTLEKPCVVLLNKFRQRAKEVSKSNTLERANQWKEKINQISSFPVLKFDAHWKAPLGTEELYKIIKELLPYERRILFEEGLNNFYNSQEDIRRKISLTIVELISTSRQRVSVDEMKDDIGPGDGESALKKKLENMVREALEKYFKTISEIYKLNAIQNTNDDIVYSQHVESRFWAVVTSSSTIAGVGTAFGSATGAAIGAVVGFFGLAGVGAGPAAMLGAQIGATIAGISGLGLGALSGQKTHYEGQVSQEFLQSTFDKGVGLAYAMSCHGFGLGTTLRDEDIISMVEKAHKLREKNYKDISLIFSSDREIDLLAQTILKEMEEKEV